MPPCELVVDGVAHVVCEDMTVVIPFEALMAKRTPNLHNHLQRFSEPLVVDSKILTTFEVLVLYCLFNKVSRRKEEVCRLQQYLDTTGYADLN